MAFFCANQTEKGGRLGAGPDGRRERARERGQHSKTGPCFLATGEVVKRTGVGARLHINVSIAFYQLAAMAPDVWTVLPLQERASRICCGIRAELQLAWLPCSSRSYIKVPEASILTCIACRCMYGGHHECLRPIESAGELRLGLAVRNVYDELGS